MEIINIRKENKNGDTYEKRLINDNGKLYYQIYNTKTEKVITNDCISNDDESVLISNIDSPNSDNMLICKKCYNGAYKTNTKNINGNDYYFCPKCFDTIKVKSN